MKINPGWLAFFIWAFVALPLVLIYTLAFASAIPAKLLYALARPLQRLLDRLSAPARRA